MPAPTTKPPRTLSDLAPTDFTTAQKVSAIAVVLIVVQLGFRAWAAFGGWFYVDDFKFLSSSREQPLSLDMLMSPHDNKLMPGGLLIAWMVAKSGAFAWPVAAASLVVMQAIASVAAWAMLRTLFGSRWPILPLLAVYLFAPMTLTAFMWWGAAINLIPMQIGMFLAVTAHVRYLDTSKYRYALAATGAIVLAMVFYQKALLIYPVLAVMTLAYFGQQGIFKRTLTVLASWWRGWLTYGATLAIYLAYTFIKVPSPVSTEGAIDYAGVMKTLTFETFATTALGGPWQWSTGVLPAAQIDPPAAVIAGCLLLFASAFVWSVRTRRNAWPAWALLITYVLVDGALLATGRGSTAGVLAAVEARYVSDAAPVLILALGLAFLPLTSGQAHSSSPRPAASQRRVPRQLMVGVGATLTVMAAVSSYRYVQFWHDDFAARTFVGTVTQAADESGTLTVLDAEVPTEVLLPGLFPYTLPSVFFNGSVNIVSVESGTNVLVLDELGASRIPDVFDGVLTPEPKPGTCGKLYSTEDTSFRRPQGISLSLSGPAASFGTWMAIGYLSTADGHVTVTTGNVSANVPLTRGANTFYLRPGARGFTSLSFTDLSPSTTLCVSQVKIGHIAPSKFS